MRLTRDILIKIARDAAAQRAKVSRRIICIYLTGSVLDETPLIGGTTDIDLNVIHDSEPLQQREVVRLSDEVHLDISHYDQAVFHHPRHLRADPWLGPFIYKKPMVLHDTQHWFDFIQAATGAQFQQPEYVIQRAIKLAQSARQRWMDLELGSNELHAKRVWDYLQAIYEAGNAVASLAGDPITERRFFLIFPQRLHSLNQPELTARLAHLFTPETSEWENSWNDWLTSWKESFQSASVLPEIPVQMNPCRLAYYERAISALWDENVTAALWLLARTWTRSISILSSDSMHETGWRSAMQVMGLNDEGFALRLQHLDSYLDMVEEVIETWARKNGVSAMAEI